MSDAFLSFAKCCSRCGTAKPPGEFHRQSAAADGLSPTCKSCRSEQEKARYQAKRDEVLAAARAYRDTHRALLAEKARGYLQANQRSVRASAALRYRLNKEAHAARSRAWYELHRERARALNQAWRRANPDRARAIAATRDARKRGAMGRVSSGIVARLMKLQRGRCACCGASLRPGKHLDHITPLSLGGEHADRNLQLLTPRCNLRKKAADPIEWAQRQGRLL